MTKRQQGKSAKGPGGGQRQMHVRVKTAAGQSGPQSLTVNSPSF